MSDSEWLTFYEKHMDHDTFRKHIMKVAKPSKYTYEQIWIKLMFQRNHNAQYPIFIDQYERGNEDPNSNANDKSEDLQAYDVFLLKNFYTRN